MATRSAIFWLVNMREKQKIAKRLAGISGQEE
jgi:hypothetical protein